jgi:Zn-dependent protease with chaperone function
MGAAARTKTRIGLISAALLLMFLFVLFQLARHPETLALLTALPNPAVLVCNIRCLGLMPFLQVLGETGRGLILIVISFSLLYASARTGLRIARTWNFLERINRRAVLDKDVPRPPFLGKATIFEDPRPLAFTAGLLRPRIFLSTKLLENLDEEELRVVVLHESHHQRSKDPLKSLAVSFVSDFLFFLPVSKFLKKAYWLESETAADARSVEPREDPLAIVGLLLKVRKLDGLQASWFFDPTTERVKRLLGEQTRIFPSFKKIILAIGLLAITAFIALVPLKKSLIPMFIRHDQTCVLRSGHQ